jgi:hypothetical protein
MAWGNAARRVMLLLAAVLTVLAASAHATDSTLTVGQPGDAVSGWQQHYDAAPRAGLSGRPAATPSVLRIAGPAELLPFAIEPSAVPRSVLARLSLHHNEISSPPYSPQRPAQGDRAPPGGRFFF